MGANRCDTVRAVCGSASGGSDQAGLSRDPGTPRKATTGARAGAGTGAVTRRLERTSLVLQTVEILACAGTNGGRRITQADVARHHRLRLEAIAGPRLADGHC